MLFWVTDYVLGNLENNRSKYWFLYGKDSIENKSSFTRTVCAPNDFADPVWYPRASFSLYLWQWGGLQKAWIQSPQNRSSDCEKKKKTKSVSERQLPQQLSDVPFNYESKVRD